jgi:hypothetical protein
MKFLCVPCDSPMKLQTVGAPERGALSVVYSCPECGYEMAMLTNPFETQLVQSLGVRIGPDSGGAASSLAGGSAASDPGARLSGDEGNGRVGATSDAGCPFAAMMPPAAPKPVGEGGAIESAGVPSGGEARSVQPQEAIAVRWTTGAEARLANIPAFVRPMARMGIERFARERGALEVDEKILDAARDFFGM